MTGDADCSAEVVEHHVVVPDTDELIADVAAELVALPENMRMPYMEVLYNIECAARILDDDRFFIR